MKRIPAARKSPPPHNGGSVPNLGDIIFLTGSRKTGIIRSQFFKSILQSKVFRGKKEGFENCQISCSFIAAVHLITPGKASMVQKRPVPRGCYRRLPYLGQKWELHSHGDPIYMCNSTKHKIKFHISLKAKRNFDEIHVGCTPWIADTWKVDH